VIAGHPNCLAVGRYGTSDFGTDDNNQIGHDVLCFARSVGPSGQCIKVESHTPGDRTADEVQFHVDGTTKMPATACASIKTAASKAPGR
jgi:hypothetical protein